MVVQVPVIQNTLKRLRLLVVMVTLVRRCFAKVRYLNWDDSKDRSKEIFGAGLFKVSENSIKIRFSNELGSAWQHFQQLFLS